MYEVNTLVYATVELGNTPEQRSARENTLLEFFAVHARCLNDFLWHDRGDRQPRDAFAADFCAPGDWERVRDDLPQAALEDVRNRRRFGREIMHLTYDRIDGDGEDKRWPCGAVVLEVAGALREFATRSPADRLDPRAPSPYSACGRRWNPPRGTPSPTCASASSPARRAWTRGSSATSRAGRSTSARSRRAGTPSRCVSTGRAALAAPGGVAVDEHEVRAGRRVVHLDPVAPTEGPTQRQAVVPDPEPPHPGDDGRGDQDGEDREDEGQQHPQRRTPRRP